jgi:hypothetical protein
VRAGKQPAEGQRTPFLFTFKGKVTYFVVGLFALWVMLMVSHNLITFTAFLCSAFSMCCAFVIICMV